MPSPYAAQPGPGPSRRLLADLYELLGNTGFAITILIVLAAASIAGIALVDQVPVRGEAARAAYAERLHEPLVWLLVHVVPDRPFRCPGYQALLALLSLSLLACTIKRWRRTWRLALRIGPAPDSVFDGAEAVRWRTRRDAPDLAAGYLRRRLFRLHPQESTAAPGGTEGREIQLAASRFGLARIGPVFTHVGFLLLVVGAIVMGLSGSSRMLWLRPGAGAGVPGTDLALHLEDFRIETTPSGRVSAYISTVMLREGGRDVRRSRIEVNKPLRHRGYSFYQNSYRQNPTRLAAIDLVTDAAPAAARAASSDPSRAAVGPHGRAGQSFEMPVTTRVPWGERVALPNSPFAVEIDTFLIDFVVGERGPELASFEPRNPAVLLAFYEGERLAGRSWHFVHHPGMAVGTAPEVPLLLGHLQAEMMAGIEVATHPGSAWIWAGFVVMSLGTLLAFALRHERVWLRMRRRDDGWDVALHHPGAPPLAPEQATAEWAREVSGLTARLVRLLEPDGRPPVRGPEGRSA